MQKAIIMLIKWSLFLDLCAPNANAHSMCIIQQSDGEQAQTGWMLPTLTFLNIYKLLRIRLLMHTFIRPIFSRLIWSNNYIIEDQDNGTASVLCMFFFFFLFKIHFLNAAEIIKNEKCFSFEKWFNRLIYWVLRQTDCNRLQSIAIGCSKAKFKKKKKKKLCGSSI